MEAADSKNEKDCVNPSEMNTKPKRTSKMEIQRNQLLFLLSGGELTKQAVINSGLGEGVLIERRHLACQLDSAQRKLNLALETLDDIAVMPRQARARRLAASTATFIRQLAQAKWPTGKQALQTGTGKHE